MRCDGGHRFRVWWLSQLSALYVIVVVSTDGLGALRLTVVLFTNLSMNVRGII